MNILFYHRDLPPDTFTGVAVQVHRLANALTEKGLNVNVATYSGKPSDARYNVLTLKQKGLQKILLKFFPFAKRIIYSFFIKNLSTLNSDIFHIHGDGAFVNYKHNTVRTFYGTARQEAANSVNLKGKVAQNLSYLLEKIENKKLRQTGASIAISRDTALYLDSIKNIIPCMLSGSVQKKAIQPGEIRQMLYVGSIFTRKRGELALNLYLQVAEQYPHLKFQFICKDVGAHENYFGSINHLNIKPPVFRENLSFDQMKNAYNSSQIFLSLSDYEGFGVGVIEAMASGCAVLSSKNPGSLDIIDSGVNGILSEDYDLVKSLIWLLEEEAKTAAIRQQAQISAKKYLPESVSDLYLKCYNKILFP